MAEKIVYHNVDFKAMSALVMHLPFTDGVSGNMIEGIATNFPLKPRLIMASETKKKADFLKGFKDLLAEAVVELTTEGYEELLNEIEIELNASSNE